MDAKAPSLCRLCGVKLASPRDWRRHAKSETHIYNLRVRVAEPGRTVTPPAPAEDKHLSWAAARRQRQPCDLDSSCGDESDTDSDSQPSTPPEFIPERCLFCDQTSSTFQDNMLHMSKDHSFVVPYRDALVVDFMTVVAYLHLVIYNYRECILCSSRRSTHKAVQQHMTAKGHCRLNMDSEATDFYGLSPNHAASLSGLVRPDDGSLRLPSGRLLSHRTRKAGTRPQSTHQMINDDRRNSSSRLQSRSTDAVIARIEDDPIAPSMQPAQLSRGDQRSLAHLPGHEMRALLSAGMKAIDRSRREETRAQLKLGRGANATLMTRSQMGYRVNLLAG